MAVIYSHYNHQRMFVDSGYRPNKPDSGDISKVYEFTRRYPRMALSCKGHDTQAVPFRVNDIEVTPRGKKSPVSLKLAHLDSDFFKSLVHSRLRIPITEPGSFHLPSDLTEDYARQILSEVRVVRIDKKPEWVALNRENHYLDCEALAAAAGYVLGVQRVPDGITRDPVNDGSEPSTETSPEDSNEGAVDAPPRDPDPDRPASTSGGGLGDIRARFAKRSAQIR